MNVKAAHYRTLEFDCVASLARRWKSRYGDALRILDFGCGTGRYLELLGDMEIDVTGVDLNPTYVQDLLSRGYDVQSVEAVLSGNDSYDVVLLSHVIEHVAPEELSILMPRLCRLVRGEGCLVIISPILGERFYHDFSHVRPYYPQSIRHAFGQTMDPLSFGTRNEIELSDIHFFKDPFRTRKWRTFYVGTGVKRRIVDGLNRLSDTLWRISSGRIGITASWLGVYRVNRLP